jgi:Protein of unknown function (DUF2637)
MQKLPQLIRLRWVVRIVLTVGLAASVAANILHALPNPISRTIAAWPPVALLLTVELVSRIPVTRRWRAAIRITATATIASIAGWISYWHMQGVTARYGESGSASYLVPLTVDGLIVVASISLVELAVAIRALEAKAAGVSEPQLVIAEVEQIADRLSVPETPAVVVEDPAPVVARRKELRPAGRSGPQVSRPVMSPLDPSRVLLEQTPQV